MRWMQKKKKKNLVSTADIVGAFDFLDFFFLGKYEALYSFYLISWLTLEHVQTNKNSQHIQY